MKRCLILSYLTCAITCGLSAQTLTPQQGNNGKYGFVDEAGNFVIDSKYDEVHFEFYEGVACVVKKNKFFLIDRSGKERSKTYDWAGYFDDNDLCLVNNGGKTDDYGNLLGGKYGYIDPTGKEIVPVKYARIGKFNDNGIAVINEGGALNKNGEFEGGKNGFINTAGAMLIAPKYTFVGEFDENGPAWTNIGGKMNETGECVGGKYGYIDAEAREIVSPAYDFIGTFDENGICWVNRGGRITASDQTVDTQLKEFAANETDKEKIHAKRIELENAFCIKRDALGRMITGGKYGFVNRAGKEIVAVKYLQTANTFTEGYARVSNKKYGYVDMDGREIIKPAYDGATEFRNGIATVMKLNKNTPQYGLIDIRGREITPIEYAEIGTFEDGFAYVKTTGGYDKKTKVRTNSKYGFVDTDGKLLTALKYDGVGKINQGVAVCRIGQQVGYVDNTGREITPFSLVEAYPFADGVARVKLWEADAAATHKGDALPAKATIPAGKEKPAKYGLIDREGNALTEFIYTRIDAPSEGLLAAVDRQGRGGWLDLQGNAAIPFDYDDVGAFQDGLAPVQTAKRYGYIDRSGTIVIECRYQAVANEFLNGVACVKSGTLWGGINRDGETVIPFGLETLEDAQAMIREIYLPNGSRPLTEREVAIYNIRKKNSEKHFALTTTIANEYWDY